MTTPAPAEGRLLFVLAVAQFVTIIDFMMIMPLGPDFAAALSINMGHLGWIGGAYTLSAAFSGILAAVQLDKFDRRKVMLVSLGGLGFFTGLAAFAWNFETLLLSRFLCGIFGGPSTAICYAIIADAVPAHRRGVAMGKVMGAFSFASVLGVPFGLELARWFGWQAPFISSALCITVAFVLAFYLLSPMTGHMAAVADIKGFRVLKRMLKSPLNMMVFLYAGLGSYSSFLIIPNLAAYAQFNLGFPREHLGWMYMAGGFLSFFILRLAGKVIDRSSASVVSIACSILLVTLFYFGMIAPEIHLPVLAIYVMFIAGSALRNVSNNTLASKIPVPSQRAGFLALMSSISQIFAAAGAFTSGVMLTSGADGALVGISQVALLAMVATCFVPTLMILVERRIVLRDKAAELITPPEIRA